MSDHAIQRWSIGWEPAYGQEQRAVPPDSPPENEELWCKSKDVEELERVIIEQSKTHAGIVEGLRKQIAKLKDYEFMYLSCSK